MKDTFFFLALIILGLLCWFLFVVLPHWIGMIGASLKLWKYDLPAKDLQETRKALELLTAAEPNMNDSARGSLKKARESLEQALATRGIRAYNNLAHAREACLLALNGGSPALRGEVKHALGLPV